MMMMSNNKNLTKTFYLVVDPNDDLALVAALVASLDVFQLQRVGC